MTSERKKQPSSEAAPDFEESLDELQQIVAELEDGSVGLEESMQRFERGVLLLRRCFKTLEEAEQKIEVLTRMNGEGEVETAPFDATATVDEADGTAGRRSRRKAAESADKADDDSERSTDTTLF